MAFTLIDEDAALSQAVTQLNENLTLMRETFVGPTAPPDPVDGQLWFDNSGGAGAKVLKIYDASEPAWNDVKTGI